jgi:hypothetical protein
VIPDDEPRYHATPDKARAYERAVLEAAYAGLPGREGNMVQKPVGDIRLEGEYPDTQLVMVRLAYYGITISPVPPFPPREYRWWIWRDFGLWEDSRPFEGEGPPAPERLVGTMFLEIDENG